MKPSRDPLALTAHWHVDCRLEAELPEDNVIGRRFLINALFSMFAGAALLFTGWLAYLDISLRAQIGDWDQRIRDNRSEVRDIQRLQREYAVEAAKIDQAYALVRPRVFVAELLTDIGKTRPEPMIIDMIEWNDVGMVVRGSFLQKSEIASKRLAAYVDQLRHDPKIGPLFRDIVVSDMTRTDGADAIRFEIKFTLVPPRA